MSNQPIARSTNLDHELVRGMEFGRENPLFPRFLRVGPPCRAVGLRLADVAVEGIDQFLRHRPHLPGTDDPPVDLGDGHDFRPRAGQEALVGDV